VVMTAGMTGVLGGVGTGASAGAGAGAGACAGSDMMIAYEYNAGKRQVISIYSTLL
jgi:hypothetical protein